MLFDAQNQLCVAQAFAATAVSANSYAKQTAAQDLSIGEEYSLLVIPTVAAGAGSTHVLEVIQADDAALTVNVQSLASVTKAAAALTVGAIIQIPIPPGSMSKKYIGFKDTISGGTTTVTLDVYLMPEDDIPVFKSFPKVVNADI